MHTCRGWLTAALTALLGAVSAWGAQGLRVAEAVAAEGGPLREPKARARAVQEISEGQRERRLAAETRAKRLGWPLRGRRPGGGVFELVDFDGDVPLYRTTFNANAAISSGADLMRQAPYGVDGSGGTVGVWDASSARTTHREFGGRVVSMDGAAATAEHSSHVVGTVCAAGVDPAAAGMATAVRVESYDWNNDEAEMASRGASYPGEPGTLNLSNHSYGYEAGWVSTGLASPAWLWYGAGTDAAGVEENFGQYNTYTRDTDALADSLPYYLMFWAAGNDRNNNPAAGQAVSFSASGFPVTAYDSALHPPGDGTYKGGYDTIGFTGLAKNVLTVGAVRDAVSNGVRSVENALITSFTSWGPADDGRIKPDVVANGNQLKSTSNTGDDVYSTLSGTSMASPSAAGTSLLLHRWFAALFTNQVMRASTMKALLIHTADDRGTPGPDYQYGWGLINATAAAELLADYRTHAGTRRVIEDLVATNRPAVTFAFTWDGATPLRATLCWSDPAGLPTALHDARAAALVNNLDLRVIGPSDEVYEPWVMPFVGDWSDASCAFAATTGSNVTDNVEQVRVAAPGAAGTYTVRVSYAGALTNGRQPFSLVLSGPVASQRAEPPAVTALTPATGISAVPLALAGDRLMLGARIALRRGNRPEREASNIEVLGDSAGARVQTMGLESGWWHLAVTNPDGQSDWLWNAFHVPVQVLAEDCETADVTARGWSFTALVGASLWAVTNAQSVSPTRSLFSPGAATRSDTCLVSPAAAVPAGVTNVTLSFRHAYDFTANDGGVLEVALDGGGWADVMNVANVVEGAYTGQIDGVGQPATLNPLKGRQGWIDGSAGFRRVTVEFDAAQSAGHSLRFRWRLGTDSALASAGWFLDDIALYDASVPPPAPFAGSVLQLR